MKKLIALVVSTGLIITACNKKETTDSDTTADSQAYNAESAVSSVGSASGAVEGSIGLASLDLLASEFRNMDYLDPQTASINPQAACSLSQRSTCSSNVITLDWGGCAVGNATLTGIWTETYSDSSCLMNVDNNTVTRTTGLSPVVLTGPLGATFSTDTSGGTAYDGTAMGSSGITVEKTASGRTIAIDSIHKVFKTPKGNTRFDYFIKTGTAVTVTGSRAAGTRTITGGNISIYHNLARYTATHTFTSVAWGDSTCCYPNSGSVSSSFSGDVTGSTTMTFSSTCGSASFTDTTGTTSTVTLSQCE